MTSNNIEVQNFIDNSSIVDLSIIGLVLQADIVVKTVMLLLLFASIWCWAIIIDKLLFFRGLKLKTLNFENIFLSADSFITLFDKIKKRKNNPLGQFYQNNNPMSAMFMHAINACSEYKSSKDTLFQGNLREKIFYSIENAKNKDLEKMEKNLIILATVGSAAPFIGLFGTVWGIVNSFKAIGQAQNTSLAVVAPGIAEALLATAIGLFAAIPAVIFYNIFSNEIRQISAKLEEFSGRLCATLTSDKN